MCGTRRQKLCSIGALQTISSTATAEPYGECRVTGGVSETFACRYGEFSALLESSKRGRITVETELPEELAAPIAEGECVGRVIYKCGDETVGEGGNIRRRGRRQDKLRRYTHEDNSIFSSYLEKKFSGDIEKNGFCSIIVSITKLKRNGIFK